MRDESESLKRTPLYEAHTSLNARMVPFSGWEMPVQYSGILTEHQAVRSAAGLFDVSHMGEFEFTGPQAEALVQHLTVNDVAKLAVGQAQYSLMLNGRGGTVDDVIVYRLAPERYLMVVNGGNVDKDWEHVASIAEGFTGATARNRSDEYALLALQGPRAVEIMRMLTDDPTVAEIPSFHLVETNVGGLEAIVARTGYTGEDGFEIFVASDMALPLWENVLAEGEMHGLVPAGLGARDTLRLEASLPLYGHELDDETSPIEAGLGFFVSREGHYLGSDTIRAQRANGVSKKLVMLVVQGRGIPRQGYPVFADGQQVGTVTSGSLSPTLNKGIAMAFVAPEYGDVGRTLQVMIREKPAEAEVVKRPFYRRPGRS